MKNLTRHQRNCNGVPPPAVKPTWRKDNIDGRYYCTFEGCNSKKNWTCSSGVWKVSSAMHLPMESFNKHNCYYVHTFILTFHAILSALQFRTCWPQRRNLRCIQMRPLWQTISYEDNVQSASVSCNLGIHVFHCKTLYKNITLW